MSSCNHEGIDTDRPLSIWRGERLADWEQNQMCSEIIFPKENVSVHLTKQEHKNSLVLV